MVAKLLPLRPCFECWETFEPKKASDRYCCETCRKIARLKELKTKGKESLRLVPAKKTTGEWTVLRFSILRRDGWQCKYCGRTPADGVKLHVDHIVAKARGGLDNPDNLITACVDCNLGKSASNLTPEECEVIRNRAGVASPSENRI